MSQNDQNKMRWLRPGMPGDDDAVIKALFDAVPSSENLDPEGLKSMEGARDLMAELFLRGISLQRWYQETGITGAPVDPKQPGMERNPMCECPIYYRLWHIGKEPKAAAEAIKNILRSRKEAMPEDYRAWFTLQLAIDVDNNVADQPYTLDAGLTPEAVCLEFSLNDVESAFTRIDNACAALSARAHNQLRITLGSWAQQEYQGMCTLSLFSKRLPSRMGTEWLLFKSIHRLAGRNSWFWRLVARWQDNREERMARKQQQ